VFAVHAIERPLKLGELLAETVRLYGDRIWASLGLGAIYAGTLFAASLVHDAASYAVAAFMVAATYGVASRLASGDSFREAWAQVAVRLPVLLVLAFVVGLPFVLASSYLVLLLLAAMWIALTGFSIPVVMLERESERQGWLASVGYALERTVALARTEYLHAAGVASALVAVNLLLGIFLTLALVGFAENTAEISTRLAQVVLAPFFFLGLTVLYFEQKARAVSSRGQTG
jgi:hypothetical protein